jgi:hypothetical protein
VFGTILGAGLSYYLSQRQKSEKQIFWIWRVAFDRSAFKGKFIWHSNRDHFRKAISDTIKAIDTGLVTTRSGQEVTRGEGKSFVKNKERRLKMDEVERRLEKIRGMVPQENEGITVEIAVEIDRERDKIIKEMNEIWRSLGIPELPIPTEIEKAEDVWPHE